MRPWTGLLLAVLLGSAACQDDHVTNPSPELGVTAAAAYSYEWLSGGGYHTCLSQAPIGTSSFKRMCWGLNSQGQVGIGSLAQQVHTPTTVPNQPGGIYTLNDGGQSHTCSLVGSQAYCWGQNSSGQLGIGNRTSSNTPRLVSGGITWRQITTGQSHTCGVNNIGVAFCWGRGLNGQLGYGGIDDKLVPTPVNTAIAFGALSAGGLHTCGWPNGLPVDAYCWGSNSSGQLGTGNTTSLLKPGPKVVSSSPRWAYLVSGHDYVCAVTWPQLLAYCWGNNSYYQVGTLEGGWPLPPHQTRYTTPQPVALGYRMTPIVAGSAHTCGRRDNGIIYCWGRGNLGQLGNGFYANRPHPYPVYGGFTYQERMASGADHVIAVRSDGAVVGWGSNRFGQVGDGTTFDRASPVVVIP